MFASSLSQSYRLPFNFFFVLCLLFLISPVTVRPQTLGSTREIGRQMLNSIKYDINKNYYDPSFHGIDLDTHFKAADEKIKQASSINEVLGIIAAAVIAFNDSHTYFVPPMRATRVEHGWQLQMIGNKCYIVAVEPGSDGAAKGLKPGDLVLSLNGVDITRQGLPTLQYIFYILSPRTSMDLVVENPAGQRRQLTVDARVHEGKKLTDLNIGVASDRINLIREAETLSQLYRHRYYEIGDTLVWKMPQFDLSEPQIDEMMSKAKKRKALVLDLRGNGGGYETILLRLLGHFFDHDVKIGELKRRSETKPLIAKTRGNDPFNGKLVVLLNSESASASEVFAHVIQAEKRGTVIGDRSAGLVMRGKSYDHQIGQNVLIYYSLEVTDADLIHSDGKSLERVGVKPDELMLPKADDLAAGRDPVLAYAARLAGLQMTPEHAGTLFPVEWRK